jgi:hypothetical protein
MTEARWGCIVNLSSTSALGNRGQANYSTAKAGLQGFTKTLAIELGKFGVTVNSVAPGFIVTEMTAATAARVGVSFDDFIKAAADRPRSAARASQRTSRTRSRSSLASRRASSQARSSTWLAAPAANRERLTRSGAGSFGLCWPAAVGGCGLSTRWSSTRNWPRRVRRPGSASGTWYRASSGAATNMCGGACAQPVQRQGAVLPGFSEPDADCGQSELFHPARSSSVTV